MPRSRNMPIPKATSGPFCSRFDPHKTKMEDQAAPDRSVDIEGRGCKAVSGNCCCGHNCTGGYTRECFDHGAGHPLLLLCNAKAPNYCKNKTFNDLAYDSEWPKVAGAGIK